MKVLIHINTSMFHQHWFAGMMREGIIACGDSAQITSVSDESDADLHVYWSAKNARCVPFLVAEAGYLNGHGNEYVHNRLRYVSFGFMGQHGHSASIPDMPGDRAMEHGLVPQPWTEWGEWCVVFGQVPGDYGIRHLNYQDAIDDLVAQCNARFGRGRVRFKPHPLAENMHTDCVSVHGDVARVLQQCFLAVTINSNAAVDALLAGVPTVTTDSMSVAYEVTPHSIGDDAAHLRKFRDQWAFNLAWRQWLPDEIKSGAAWRFIKWVWC